MSTSVRRSTRAAVKVAKDRIADLTSPARTISSQADRSKEKYVWTKDADTHARDSAALVKGLTYFKGKQGVDIAYSTRCHHEEPQERDAIIFMTGYAVADAHPPHTHTHTHTNTSAHAQHSTAQQNTKQHGTV